jgi:FkbM family methyltransferase
MVMAIEPQRPMFQTMCANAILNDYLNVHPVMAAAAAAPSYRKLIEPDYTKPNSFGGFETTPRAASETGTATRMERIDLLWFQTFGEKKVAFVKIDVEGSEAAAIRGASHLLRRDRPILYVENDRREHSAELIGLLREYGYEPYWHVAPFYNPDNLAGRPDDIPMHRYGWVGGKINGASVMLLCVPPEKSLPVPAGMRKVGGADEYPPFEGEA